MTRELYEESALYGMLFRERTADVAWYRQLAAARGGPVLELGVGSGRVALALVDDGHEVVGVDRSASMLDALRARRDGRAIALHEADMRDVRLDAGRFALVICPFNGFAHLHEPADRDAFFETVRHHLRPDGRFAFDVTIPDPAQLAGGTSFVPRMEHPRTGAVCRMQEVFRYDGGREVLTITTELTERATGDAHRYVLALRQWHPPQTEQLLSRSGWTVESRSAAIGDSLAYVCRVS